MRIDGALVPPGIIAGAKMYSIFVEQGNLYLIFTGAGPAAQKDYSKALKGYRLEKGALENLAVGALMKKYITTIKAAEAGINVDNLDEAAKGKNCQAIPLSQVSDAASKVTPVDIRLTFKGGGKKLKFDLSLDDKLLVDELVATLNG